MNTPYPTLTVQWRGHAVSAVPFQANCNLQADYDLWIDGCEFITSDELLGSESSIRVIQLGAWSVDDGIKDGIFS